MQLNGRSLSDRFFLTQNLSFLIITVIIPQLTSQSNRR